MLSFRNDIPQISVLWSCCFYFKEGCSWVSVRGRVFRRRFLFRLLCANGVWSENWSAWILWIAQKKMLKNNSNILRLCRDLHQGGGRPHSLLVHFGSPLSPKRTAAPPTTFIGSKSTREIVWGLEKRSQSPVCVFFICSWPYLMISRFKLRVQGWWGQSIFYAGL